MLTDDDDDGVVVEAEREIPDHLKSDNNDNFMTF